MGGCFIFKSKIIINTPTCKTLLHLDRGVGVGAGLEGGGGNWLGLNMVWCHVKSNIIIFMTIRNILYTMIRYNTVMQNLF